MAQEMDYLISMSVELEKGKKQIESIYNLLKETFSKPITVKIIGQANFGPAVAAVGKLDQAIKKVETSTAKAEQEMQELDRRASETAERMNTTLAGSADALTKAFALGRKNAEAEVGRMVANMQQQIMSAATRHRRTQQLGVADRALSAVSGASKVPEAVRKEVKELHGERRELLEQQKDLAGLYRAAHAEFERVKATNTQGGKLRINDEYREAKENLSNILNRAETVARAVTKINNSLAQVKNSIGGDAFGELEAQLTGAATAEQKLEAALQRLSSRMQRLLSQINANPASPKAGIKQATLERMGGEYEFLENILEGVRAGSTTSLRDASERVAGYRTNVQGIQTTGSVGRFQVNAMNYVDVLARRQARSPYMDLRHSVLANMRENNTPVYIQSPTPMAQMPIAGIAQAAGMPISPEVKLDPTSIITQVATALQTTPFKLRLDTADIGKQLSAILLPSLQNATTLSRGTETTEATGTTPINLDPASVIQQITAALQTPIPIKLAIETANLRQQVQSVLNGEQMAKAQQVKNATDEKLERKYWDTKHMPMLQMRYAELAKLGEGVHRVTEGAEDFFIYVDKAGKVIAQLGIALQRPGGKPMKEDALDVKVHPDYRRQGIGTALYKAAEEAGYDIEKLSGSGILTHMGKAFREGRLAKKEGAAGEGFKIPVGVDRGFLHQSIRDALKALDKEGLSIKVAAVENQADQDAAEAATTRIAADQQFLFKSIRDALKILEKEGLNVKVTATMGEKEGEEAGKNLELPVGVDRPFFFQSVREAIKVLEKEGLVVKVAATFGEEEKKKADATKFDVQVGVDRPFLHQSIRDALKALEKEGLRIKVAAVIEEHSQQAVGKSVTQAIQQGVATIVNSATKAAKGGHITRSERDALRAQILTNPLDALKDLGMSQGGIDQAAIIERMFKAGNKATPDQIFAAMQARPGFLQELSKLTGPKASAASSMFGAEWMSRLKYVEDSHWGRTLNKNAQTMPSDIWQERVIAPFEQSMRAMSGQRPDFTHNIDRDLYTEQLRAYKDVLTQVRRLEEESVRWFRAKNSPEELEASRRRVAMIREELEVQEQHYRMMALAGSAPIRAMNFKYDNLGQYTETGSAYQNPADIFRNISHMFQQRYGGGYQSYLGRLDDIRSKMSARGDAEGAASVKELGFDQYLKALSGGNLKLEQQLLKSMGYAKEVRKDEQMRLAILKDMLTPLNAQLGMYQQISHQVDRQTAEMRVIEKFEQLKAHRARNPMGYARAVRGASYAFGGVAVGMAAGFAMRDAFRNFRMLEQEFADIRGVLNASVQDMNLLESGVYRVAQKYGGNLLQTAQAAKVLAQAGFTASEVVKELDATMLGVRGLGMTIEQMQELQVAVRALSGPGHTLDVLSKISKVEAEYAVTAKDLADVIRIASPVMDQYAQSVQGIGDAYDFTIGMATVMIEKLRMSGTEAGNALKFMMARLVNPEIMKKLQENFGLKMGASPTEFQQLPDLLGSIHDRWREIQKTNPAQATAFLVQLAGGRRVNALVAMLESYEKAQEVSNKSMMAFGDTERRTITATDTLNVSLDRLRTNFQLFINNMGESTQLAAGLKVAVDLLAASFAGISGEGMGTLGTLGLVATGGLAVRGMQKGYRWMEAASYLGPEAGLYMDAVRNRRVRQMRAVAGTAIDVKHLGVMARVTGLFGTMATVFTPGGALLLGLVAFAGVVGLIASLVNKLGSKENELVRLKTLQELKVFDAPQMKDYRDIAKNYGYSSTRGAFDETVKALEGKSFNDVITKINEGGKELRHEAILEFVKGLDTAKTRLNEIQSEQERVAEGMRLIGYASWAANVQIAQGIEDIGAAAQTMIDEGMSGITRIDTRTRTGFGKIAGFFGDAFKQRRTWQQSIHTDLRNARGELRTPRDQLLATLRNSGMDESLFKVFDGTEFRNAVSDAANDFSGKVIGAAELFVASTKKLSPENYNAMVERGAQAVLKKLNGGVFEASQNAVDAETDPDSIKQAREWISKLFLDIRERVQMMAGEGLYNQNALAKKLQELYEKLADPKQAEKFYLQLQGATEGLGRFKNALLDMIIGFIQQMKQMELEQTYTKKYGDTYDPVSPLRQLSRDMFVKSNMIEIEALADVFRARQQYEMGTSLLTKAGFSIEDQSLFIKGGLNQDQVTKMEETLGRQGQSTLQTYTNLRTAYDEAFKAKTSVAKLFGDSDEGIRLNAMFEELLGKIVDGIDFSQDWKKLFDEASKAIRAKIDPVDLERKTTEMQLSSRGENITAYGTLVEKQLEVETNITKQFAAREQLRMMDIIQQQDQLKLQYTQGKMEKNDYDVAQQKLLLDNDRAKVMAIITAQIEAQNNLTNQGRENLAESLSGFRDIAKTMDVVNMRAGEIVEMALGPAIQGMYGRVVDNAFDSILQAAGENEGIMKMFQGPEFMMRQAIVDSSNLGSIKMYEQIVAASYIAAQNLAAGISGGMLTAPTGPAGGAGTAVAGAKKTKGADLYASLGSMAGALGGAAVGGGGTFAGLGSMAGSMLPMFLSMGGPLGAGVGIVGGLVGGLLGGMFDKDDKKQDLQISQLDAIERAQKDTITAIEAQTDALLRPENRFLNLPTNFTVPAYNPGTGGAQVGQLIINVNASGLSPEQATKVVEDAVNNALYSGTRNQSLSGSRF